jgi:hypothetical protein
MNQRLRFTVGSTPERDHLVADLLTDDVTWAQITQESGELEIEVYCNPEGRAWIFKLDDMMRIVASARERLIQLRRN